ncbi:MAG TPA: hypothetical protein VGF69_15805 [Thermoanaerobaculia bacterium]|jgi:YD repeat-containing protein
MRLIPLFAALLALQPLLAQNAPNPVDAVGFSGEKAMAAGDYDTINEYNGNVVLTIPLGPRYHVRSAMSYGLAIVYNSKVWEFQKPQNASRYTAVPTRESNAGLGWLLSLGALKVPCPATSGAQCSFPPLATNAIAEYRSPDGAKHDFYTVLHPNETVPETTNGVIGYTRDGTYLRLKFLNDVYSVEFPDGTTHRFDYIPNTNRTKLSSMEDATGNAVAISYAVANEWRLTDDHGRQQVVRFENVSGQSQDNYQTRPKEVELTAFNGKKLLYKFIYQDLSYVKPCHDMIDPNQGSITVPSLTSIEVVDVAAPAVPLQTFTFGYYTNDTNCHSGALSQMVVPTGGSVAYEYQKYTFPGDECSGTDVTSVGIRSRTVSDGVNPPGTWEYRSAITERPSTDGTFDYLCGSSHFVNQSQPPEEIRNTVYSPTGEKVVSYFTAWPHANAVGGSPTLTTSADDGMPYSRRFTSGDRFLSKEYYDCTGDPFDASNCQLRRSVYVKYERDAIDTAGRRRPGNKRLIGSKTVHSEPAGTWTDVTMSDFDGLGHYRQSTQTSNVKGIIESRTSFTNYNDGSGTYAPSSGTYSGTFQQRSTGLPWIVGTFSSQWTSANGSTTKTTFDFDGNSGLLQWARRFAATASTASGIAAQTNDVVTALCYDANGDVAAERTLGGDRAAAPGTSNLCTGPVDFSNGEIEVVHTYAATSGARVSSQYSGAGGVKHHDATVDQPTDLPVTARDTAGVATSYEYDALGRITWIRPTGRAHTQVEYYRPGTYSGTTRAVVRARRWQSNGLGSALTEERYEYDGLGRLYRAWTKLPNSQWSVRQTRYDVEGRLVDASEADTTPTHYTQFLEYDSFGRPLRVRAADGSETTYTYQGVSSMTRTVRIALPWGETDVTTTEKYDMAGRLWQVIEPSGPTSATSAAGAAVTTTYGYDTGGRLTTVSIAGVEGTQPRSFTYDGRGFLLSETHPENGTITYTQFSASGHARFKDGAGSAFDQRFTYDSAGRLTEIATWNPYGSNSEQNTQPEYRPVKTFQYATENAGSNLTKGKLESAARYTYVPGVGAFLANETYEYQDAAGRRTHKTTDLAKDNFGTYSTFRTIGQSYAWNELDAPAMITYPICLDCGVPPAGSMTSVQMDYSEGALTNIPGYVSSILYHVNGVPATITHNNGIVEQRTIDPNNMPRPRSIQFGSFSTCTPPSILTQPVDQSIHSGSAAALSVAVSGTAPFQYQWQIRSANYSWSDIAGAVQSTYNPAPTQTSVYRVVVTNSCRTLDSAEATVTVTAPVAPSITTQPQDVTLSSGATTQFTVAASGSGTLQYQWYRGSAGDTSQPVGTNAVSYTASSVTATTRYWARVTNSGGSVDSRTAVATIPLTSPTGLTATRTSPSRITVSWSAAAGAHAYRVERREVSTGAFVAAGTAVIAPATTYFDDDVIAGRTYLYRVRAVDANEGSASPYSNQDLATMIAFTPVTAGMTVDDAHFQQLFDGLNAIRASIGWAAVSWSTILPAGVPAPAAGVRIDSRHLTALRAYIDLACDAAGIPGASYADPSPGSTTPIRAVHVTSLQGRMQ